VLVAIPFVVGFCVGVHRCIALLVARGGRSRAVAHGNECCGQVAAYKSGGRLFLCLQYAVRVLMALTLLADYG